MPEPGTAGPRLWRVFPWSEEAPEGARFSPSFVPDPSGRGRFDLPRSLSPVLYLAETPEHAVAESLQPWRGRALEAGHLTRAGLPLAAVTVEVGEPDRARLVDLCDPAALGALPTAPDTTASRLRERTQPVARAAWEGGASGLRWWSSFWGDWHTVVLFTARLAQPLRFGAPEVLTPDAEPVRRAAELLGMRMERPRPRLHRAPPHTIRPSG